MQCEIDRLNSSEPRGHRKQAKEIGGIPGGGGVEHHVAGIQAAINCPLQQRNLHRLIADPNRISADQYLGNRQKKTDPNPGQLFAFMDGRLIER